MYGGWDVQFNIGIDKLRLIIHPAYDVYGCMYGVKTSDDEPNEEGLVHHHGHRMGSSSGCRLRDKAHGAGTEAHGGCGISHIYARLLLLAIHPCGQCKHTAHTTGAGVRCQCMGPNWKHTKTIV